MKDRIDAAIGNAERPPFRKGAGRGILDQYRKFDPVKPAGVLRGFGAPPQDREIVVSGGADFFMRLEIEAGFKVPVEGLAEVERPAICPHLAGYPEALVAGIAAQVKNRTALVDIGFQHPHDRRFITDEVPEIHHLPVRGPHVDVPIDIRFHDLARCPGGGDT